MFNPMLNVTLDILEGCKYTCMGCAVDRDLVIRDIPQEDIDGLLRLAHEIKEQHYGTLFEFTVGPTDFIASKNGMEIFEHPLIKGYMELFDAIVIPLSLLNDKGLVELAQKLNHYAAGKKLKVAVPISITNSKKPKFLALLRKHIGILKDNLVECEFFRVYSTVNLSGDEIDLVTEENLRHLALMDFGVEQTQELAFGHSRARFDDLIKQSVFLKEYRRYVEHMSSIPDSPFYTEVIPNPVDSMEIAYRNGSLYYVPVLREKFHWWDERLEIPRPWNALKILQTKENMVEANMADTKHSKDCEGCCHFFACNTGDIKTIMRLLGEGSCLPGVKGRVDLIRYKRPGDVSGRV